MELLFISHKYPPGIGGMQKQSFELIQGFGKDHKVHTVVHDESVESKFIFFLSLKSRVRKIIKTNPGIQLVHCNDGVCAFFCKWIKDEFDIPVFLTFHGLDLLWPNKIYQKYLSRMIQHFDGLICVSDYTAQQCLKRNVPHDKIFIAYNGVDVNVRYDQSKINSQLRKRIKDLINADKKILISIGRPVKRKGFSWFIKNVLRELPQDYHYIIIGPGTQFNGFEDLIMSILPRKLRSQIELFFGWSSDQNSIYELQKDDSVNGSFNWYNELNYDSLLFALRNSDLMLMPNIHINGDAEGFGLVALESNLQSTYVLASRIDGITSAIHHNKNGVLVESENEEQWKDSIIQYIELSEEERNRKSMEAFAYAKITFPWKNMCERYERDLFVNFYLVKQRSRKTGSLHKVLQLD